MRQFLYIHRRDDWRFGMSIRRRALIVGVGALAAVTATTSRGGAQSGAIVGQVRVAGTRMPLGYAVVFAASATSAPSAASAVPAPPAGREIFSDENGHFVLRSVPAGSVRISARRVGFSPADTTILVTPGDTSRVTIELSLVSIQLPAMHSLAKVCAHPGGSDAQIGEQLATLFDQVKENAARNQLLSRSYPFELEVERRISRPEPVLEARFIAYDTVILSSNRAWRYEPGKMLGTREYASGVFAGKWTTITMPELADFADERFLINHCFEFGGLDVVDGDSVIRVDFSPAPVVHDLDIAGTIFLDPVTYQLRVMDIAVVNLNRQLRNEMSGQSIRSHFREVIPGVPVLSAISSVVFPKEDPKRPGQEPSTEHHRILSVRFLRGKP
jgi:hypothetical protein